MLESKKDVKKQEHTTRWRPMFINRYHRRDLIYLFIFFVIFNENKKIMTIIISPCVSLNIGRYKFCHFRIDIKYTYKK